MEFFKFRNPTHVLRMQEGELINGLDSKLWIERYLEAGEFEFTSRKVAQMREFLPIGSFVSHTETGEIMIVEDHHVQTKRNESSTIKITGRSFETILGLRAIGMLNTLPSSSLNGYGAWVDDGYAGDQAVELMNNHLYIYAIANDALEYVKAVAGPIVAGDTDDQYLEYGSLYDRVIEILKEDDLGIRVVRPGFESLSGITNETALVVYVGQDKRDEIQFTHQTDDIEQAEYFWSNRSKGTYALIRTTWTESRFIPVAGFVGYDRRMISVDAKEVDSQYYDPIYFNSPEYPEILDRAKKRGRKALAKKKSKALTQVELSEANIKHKYRTDYGLGDTVLVVGEFGKAPMVVKEFVEIEDEEGLKRYPTLEGINEGE